MNRVKDITLKRLVLVSVLALGLAGAGCASSASNSSRAADPPDPPQASLKTAATSASAPKVQECGVVAISSPPKYACDGKVYTAMQLAKVRIDQAKKYQSGQ
jgi:hypothetical protein